MRRLLLVLLVALLGSVPSLAAPAAPQRHAVSKAPAGLREVIKRVKPATALVEVSTPDGMGWGTAFVVSSEGYLVTNAHVVEDAQRVTVYLKNNLNLPARVVATQESDDLALLKVEPPEPLYTVALGEDQSAEGVEIGVTGYPLPPILIRLGLGLDSSSVHGIMSGRRTTEGGFFPGQVVDQMDVPISAGNSGSPVYLAENGKVVGVAVSGIWGSALNFAVPVSKVKQLLVDAGLTPTVRLADGGADSVVVAGKTSTLNVLAENKVLHALFGEHEALPNFTIVERDSFTLFAYAMGIPSVVCSPVDGGSRIFFGAADGTLYDYNVKSQRLRPLVEAEEPFNFPGVVSPDMVCVASGKLDISQRVNAGAPVMNALLGVGGVVITEINGSGVLVGVNRRTGNVEWTVAGDFMSAPVMGRGQVFTGGLGTLAGYDLATGRELWKVRPDYRGGDRLWYSPAAPEGGTLMTLVVPVRVVGPYLLGRDKSRLVAFDTATGRELWNVELANVGNHRFPLCGSVLVQPAKGRVLVVSGDRVSAHSLANGALQWKYTTRPDPQEEDPDKLGNYFSPELAAADGVVYVGCEDKSLYALSESDGTVLWKVPTRGRVGVPTVAGGTVYVGSRDKYLYAFDAHTGSLQWKYHCGAPVSGRPLVKAGNVYCGTEGGTLLIVHQPPQ